MARRKRKDDDNLSSGSGTRRDPSPPRRIARPTYQQWVGLPSFLTSLPRSGLDFIRADRRRYDPEPHAPLRGSRSKARLVPVSPARGRRGSGRAARRAGYKVRFARPETVTVCHRRRERRQVMFATKKAGKRGQKPPRYNRYSHISCRRH